MKITVIILSVLVAQVSASFFDEFHGAVFSVKSSVGKLFYDVVTDFADTVDCTILAVKHVLSDKTSSRYNQKCNGDKAREIATSSDDRENVNVYTPALDSTLQAIYKNKQNFKEEQLQQVDSPVSEDERRTQIKTDLENVQNLVKAETDHLGDVSSQSRQVYEDDKTNEAMENVEHNSNTTKADINSDDIKTEKARQGLVEQVEKNTKANAHPRTFRDVAQQIFTENSLSTNQLQSNGGSIEINKGVVILTTQKPATTKEVRNSKSASDKSLLTNQLQPKAGSTEMNKGLVVPNTQKPNTTKEVYNPKTGSEESLATNQLKSNADSTEISKGQVILTTRKPDATKEVNNPKSGSNESLVTNQLKSNADSTDINKGLVILTTQKPSTTKEVINSKSRSEESLATNQLQPNADSTDISKGQVILTTQKPNTTKEVNNPKSGSDESLIINQLQSNAGSTEINKGLVILPTPKPDTTAKEVGDPKSGSQESLVTNQFQPNVGSTEINKGPVVTRKPNTTKKVSNPKSESVGLPANRTTQKPDETKKMNNPKSVLEESFVTNQLHSSADSTEMIKGLVVLTTKKPDTIKEVSNSKSQSEDSHSFFNLAPNDREAIEQARKLIEESRRSDMIMNNILKNANFASSLFDSPDLLAFGK